MNVLLIHVVPSRRAWPRGAFRSYWVPTGLACMAGVLLRGGHGVRVMVRTEQLIKNGLDHDAADRELAQAMRDFKPDIVGLSAMTPAVNEAGRLARLCKELSGGKALVVAGGPHPTALPELTLAQCPSIDAVAVGEGELTLAEIAQKGVAQDVAGLVFRRDGQFVRTPARPAVRDLDSLGPPAYELFDMAHYTSRNQWMVRFLPLRVTNIRTSRGCPAACDFCGGHLVAGLGVRFHSLDYVLDQLVFAADRLGVEAIHFEDDTLAANPARLMELCEGICRLGLHKRLVWDCCLRVDQADAGLLAQMKAAGCIQVEFGFESGSDASLLALGKRATAQLNRRAVELARHAGLRIFADIMVGLPGETKADFDATVRFIRWAKPHVLSAARLCPLPGTKIYADLPPSKRDALDWEGFAYLDQPGFECNLTAMSDAKFARLYRRFNKYLAGPATTWSLLRDTPADDSDQRRRLRRRLRRFIVRHPIHALRLPRAR